MSFKFIKTENHPLCHARKVLGIQSLCKLGKVAQCSVAMLEINRIMSSHIIDVTWSDLRTQPHYEVIQITPKGIDKNGVRMAFLL